MKGDQEAKWRLTEIGGGQVLSTDQSCLLALNPFSGGYGDAQFDDYRGLRRRDYPHRAGTAFTLRARFSHSVEDLVGTAGFGYWNAPFGDPNLPWPTLPQAAWFFFASAPNDLPVAPSGPGRGWFAGTVDARSPRALVWAPFAPIILLLNQVGRLRRWIWPTVQRGLGMSFAPLPVTMTAWHEYRLVWRPQGCFFWVDDQPVLQTPISPKGPLGFVSWIDNQYLLVRPTGKISWGTLNLSAQQWLEIADLNQSPSVM